MGAITVYSTGMVTGVGLDAPASCAAIRAGITGFQETRFMFDGDWLLGCPVPLEESWCGAEKLARMAATAIRECLDGHPDLAPDELPLLLCVAEEDRPGRSDGLGDELLRAVEAQLGVGFTADSRIIALGRAGGVRALDLARELIRDGRPGCLVAGTDSLLQAGTLNAYPARHRLMTAENSNGFIPGEGAAAALVGPVRRQEAPQLMCMGLGFGTEPAPLGAEEPLRADGLVDALRAAFADSRCDYGDVDYRLTDNNGEAYGFKEAALAMTRTLRDRKEEFDLWHPVDCVGQIGAATVPTLLGVAKAAAEKGYAPGPGALCQVGNDDESRAAFILRHRAWDGD